MSVDDFYVFFVRLFSKIMFPQKHHFSKGLGGCRWEVFDLQYIGRGEGLGGGEGNVTFISGGRGPALSPIFYLNVFFAIFSYHQQNFEMIRYDLEKMRVNYSNMESACDFSPYILLEKQETLGNFLFECFLLLLANKWNS